MTSTGIWRFVLAVIIAGVVLGIARSGILRFKRMPPSEDVDRFEVVRGAVADEPHFAESLKALIRNSPSVARLYLFRANVGQATDAFSAGLVFGGELQPDVIRQIDALWIAETGGNELLGVTPLTPELEGAVSRVCTPLFYR